MRFGDLSKPVSQPNRQPIRLPQPPPTNRSAIDEHFPPSCGVRVIAEPGRYFAETSATMFTTILGQRAATVTSTAADGGGVTTAPYRHYYLSDGTFGSFRIQVAVDGLEPSYHVLRSPLLPPPGPELAAPTACRLWGDSEREEDCVHRESTLPALRDGDFLAFPYAGAYTICSASNFGGGRMTEPTKLFVVSGEATRDLGSTYNRSAARAAATPAAAVVAGGAAPAPAALRASGSCPAAFADSCFALPLDCGAAAAPDCFEAPADCPVVQQGCSGPSDGGASLIGGANDDAMSTVSEGTVVGLTAGGAAAAVASDCEDSAMGGCCDE